LNQQILVGTTIVKNRQTTFFLSLILFGLTLTGVLESASAQHVQWASKVLKFSTQYNDSDCSARMVLGKPSVLPRGGDHPGALAFGTEADDGKIYESKGEQYITVGYARPMKIQQVGVAENNCPGAITAITLIDDNNDEHEIYKGSTQQLSDAGRMFDIFFPMTSYNVAAVRVDLMPEEVKGWNEIDAIGISDSHDSILATIHLSPNAASAHDASAPKPENLGRNINTESSDLPDAISPDGRTLYVSRDKYADNVGGVDGGRDIWYSTLQADGTWSKTQNMGSPLNNKSHNFADAVTPDGNTLLVNGVYNDDGSLHGEGLSFTHRTMSGWSMPEEVRIKNYYNKAGFSNAGLAPDGKTILLAVQRDDTQGGVDIYASFLQSDGSWSEPLDLGPDVNTFANDYGPFMAADGVSLYYATSGLSGYGRDDIFVTRRLDNTWTHWSEPENLGPTINTPATDAFYILSASGDYAYFASKELSYGDDDVFRIALPKAAKPKPVVLVSGIVYNSKTHQPIESSIKYETITGEAQSGIARSNPANGDYKIILPAGGNYGFRAEAPGFYPTSENLDTRGVNEYKEMKKDLYLTPIEVGSTIRLNNIFFESAKAELKTESAPELDRVVKFMNDNPNISIEVSGHTDNVGNDASNIALSQNRANSVVKYLTDKGVSAGRIKAKGYGKSKPIAANDTDENRQLNRRVEFTILKS
jgi:outer membrane protein OmpA-like peptidoglycan-associated protein